MKDLFIQNLPLILLIEGVFFLGLAIAVRLAKRSPDEAR
jgi:F0F1-type ATP synthase membrane subunit c/vacuolar-type H+-ATPase subunit K